MILEFFASFFISLVISFAIGLSFKLVQIIIALNKKNENTEISKTNEIPKEYVKDPKIFIDIINSRISHELTVSNSIKITSSSFVGFSAIVFSLLMTTGLQSMFDILTMRGTEIVYGASLLFWLIPLLTMVFGLAFIVLPMLIAFFNIIPKYKKEHISIRKILDDLHEKSENVILTKIKFVTLDELETLEKDNQRSGRDIKIALFGFGIGLGLIFITFLFGEGTLIDNLIGEYPLTVNP